MSFRDDRRAQSIQVGAAILLAFVVLAIAMYQAQVVPNQNQQVEYNHNQEVQSQMVEVRNGIVSVPGDGPGKSVTLQLGTTYPERTLFVNPGPPTGQVRTSPPANVTLDNAVADGEAGDYWNGDPRQYETRALVYRPNYNVMTNVPTTVYENTVVYDQYRAQAVVDTDQQLVKGRTITLVTLDGEYQEAGFEAASVDLDAVSTSRRKVAITNDTGGPVTINIPTTLAEERWRELLRPQFDENGGHVVTVNYGPGPGDYDLLTVVLEGDVTYTLQMAKVGVGTNVGDPGAQYLVDAEGDGERIQTGTNLTLVAEARDTYNNPESGVPVNATVPDPDATVTPQDTTDAEGRAEFVFNASSPGTYTVQASFGTSPGGAERANFTVRVEGSGGGGGGGGSGPPSFSSDPTISDTPSGNKAGYEVSYTVDDPSGNFSQVVVEFDCLDCSGNSGDEIKTSPSTSGTITYEGPGNSNGNDYEIIIRIEDDTGSTTDICSATDTADGSDPSVTC